MTIHNKSNNLNNSFSTSALFLLLFIPISLININKAYSMQEILANENIENKQIEESVIEELKKIKGNNIFTDQFKSILEKKEGTNIHNRDSIIASHLLIYLKLF